VQASIALRPGEDSRLPSQIKRLNSQGRDRKTPVGERFADEARFFKAWVENPMVTGAVSPSGRYLARMMARYVDPLSRGPIIELGPGTGPVTVALLKRGVAPERLVLVEFDPYFCKLLARRFPRCRIVQGDAYNLAKTLEGLLEEPAAAVVSSLPLLTRPDADRTELLRQSFAMMQPQGRFIQFTYGMVSPIPRRLHANGAMPFEAEPSPPVWLNLPPARVWVYRPTGSPELIRKEPGALIVKLRAGTLKMRGEIRETRDRVEEGFRDTRDKFEIGIRERTLRARRQFELQRLRMSKDPALRPAIALLRKLGEHRKPPRD
jgi:phosphatidylethanolamine/phosphatidyl-N-methylethanolamine N-methyltransferase